MKKFIILLFLACTTICSAQKSQTEFIGHWSIENMTFIDGDSINILSTFYIDGNYYLIHDRNTKYRLEFEKEKINVFNKKNRYIGYLIKKNKNYFKFEGIELYLLKESEK